jgi:hypothetical protein
VNGHVTSRSLARSTKIPLHRDLALLEAAKADFEAMPALPVPLDAGFRVEEHAHDDINDEQLCPLLRGHADAGVGDGELDEVAAIAHLACRKLDLARFAELAGIAQKVEQDLPQPHRVHVAEARAEISALEAAPVLDPRIRERVEAYVAGLTEMVHIKGIEAGQPLVIDTRDGAGWPGPERVADRGVDAAG